MEYIVMVVAFLWLLLETRQLRARDLTLEQELADLRRELARLRQPEQRPEPAAPRSEPVAPRSMDDTLEVEVPQWIRELPPGPAHSDPMNEHSVPVVSAAQTPASPATPWPTSASPATHWPTPASPAKPWPTPASAPSPRPGTSAPEAASAASKPPFDWESLVGVKLFSYIAGIALLVAAVAFLRYSLDNGWLSPAVRMSIGLLTGLGLLLGCETRRAQVYAITAQSLTAAGIATLFSTFYAATALWQLLPAGVAFGLMALVTAVAVLLSIRRDSVFIALLGLVGGFATPMLLATGQDNPMGLFGYLALLNLGLAWVAYRKRWPLLTAGTLAFTLLYQVGWASNFLEEAKLGIGLGVFLLFPVLAFGALILGRPRDGEAELPRLFQQATWVTALPPLLLALHVAGTPAYGEHFALMFGFLFLVAAGLAAIALFHGPEWLHTLGAAGVLAMFVTWLLGNYNPQAWPVLLAFTGLFVGLYLFVPWLQTRLRRKRPFAGPGLLAVYAAPLLLFVFPLLVVLEPRASAPGLLFGSLLVLLALVAAYAIRFEEGRVHGLACLLALVAEVTWSSRHLNPGNLPAALVLYGGFALFFLGVPVLAERRGKTLRPLGSGAILAFASLPLLLFLVTPRLAEVSLGVLAVLLGLLNLGLLFEASRGRYPWLSGLGMAFSWVLLGCWCLQALAAGTLLPALLVLTAFALLVLGGRCWLHGRGAAGSAPEGLYLGLVGHLFLFGVVLQPELAPSPWPWLAVLLVLDLALGLAALAQRHQGLLVGASLLTTAVLLGWAAEGNQAQLLALAAPWLGLGFALLGLVWFELGRRRGQPCSWAAGLGLVGTQFLLLVLRSHGHAAPFAPQLLVQLALALGLLVLAWCSGRHGWAVALAFSAGLLLEAGWAPGFGPRLTAGELLGLAAPLYLLQLGYPLALGRAAMTERLPFLAALWASAVFFGLARPALVALGYGGGIGALPVLQALLLVPHLLTLLRLEPAGQRDLGRLALVAGGILALVTVAIPLQLDKEWITLGWALLGLALAWLYGRVPHRGVLAWSAGLFAVVLVRLTLNPAVLEYHPRSAVPLLNWYLYTYLLAAACAFGAAWLLRNREDELVAGWPRLSRLLPGLGAILLFLLLNIEIADLFSTGAALTFNLRHGSLAQDLSYTIGWALFALGMLSAGIVARHRGTRVAAILLLTVTVLKAFLHDLARLEGLYRVASFVGLALSLALVAVILQKFALRRSEVA